MGHCSFDKLLDEFVFSEELVPISFANLLNEFIFSEELFPISFAKLLNEFVSRRSYFLLALLNYLMSLFLGGVISERICQSSITDNAEISFFPKCNVF